MGLTISSQNYKLVHVYTEPTQNYCISFTPIDYLINDYELLSYNDVIDNIKYNCWFIAGYDWHSIFNYLLDY